MNEKEITELARQIRLETLKSLTQLGFGHYGGSMSVVETLAVLYGAVMKIDPADPDWPERDYFVLSKGHAGPALYSTLAIKGYFPVEELSTLNQNGTRLPSHPDRLKTRGVDATTGSLGQGISIAGGMALSHKLAGRPNRVFCIVGDGELNEGQCWEAFQFIAHHRLNNLTVFVDWNKQQLDGELDEIISAFDLEGKFRAFGFDVATVKGDDIPGLLAVTSRVPEAEARPFVVILDSIKGQGVPYLEQLSNSHHLRLTAESKAALNETIAMDGVARDYPQHVINCGIMEANVIGTAAGLSLTGRKPFVHTFTAFASRRCFDQLFMSLDYQRNNVKVIASDAGVTACHNGGTHMSFEDMGIVRGLAHSVVLEVTDAVMFEDVLRQLIDLEGFYWVRTIRKQAPSVYAPGSTFTIGKGNVLREGSDITLIANGIMVAEALEAARQLEQEGVSAAVIDMFTLKPIDRMLVKNYAEKTGRIVTCENHSIHNGLGSAVAEVLVETCPVPMRRVGVKERYGQVGTQDFLQKEYGLTAHDIVSAARELL